MARPRSETANRAAVDATVAVLLDAGVEGVTFEEVASRSGVARSTLYRHFGTREALIAAAARRCVVIHPTPDTGSLDDDLRFLFACFSEAEADAQVSDLLPLLIDAARRDHAIEQIVGSIMAERRRPIMTVLRLAQLRGEIAPALDLDDAMAIVIGPFNFRRLVEGVDVTPEFGETVLSVVVAGLRATAAAPAR